MLAVFLGLGEMNMILPAGCRFRAKTCQSARVGPETDKILTFRS